MTSSSSGRCLLFYTVLFKLRTTISHCIDYKIKSQVNGIYGPQTPCTSGVPSGYKGIYIPPKLPKLDFTTDAEYVAKYILRES